MSQIPEFGKIFYVQDGVPKSRDEVLEKWSQTEFVRSTRVEVKGWLLDVPSLRGANEEGRGDPSGANRIIVRHGFIASYKDRGHGWVSLT